MTDFGILLNNIRQARADYARADAIPLKNKEPIMRRNRELVRAAVLTYYHAYYRIQTRTQRRAADLLKASNQYLSEALSAETARVQELGAQNQRLIADNRRLINEASVEAQHSSDNGKIAEVVAADADELRAGAQILRTMLQDAGCPVDIKGVDKMLAWLIEEVTTLREVNAARAKVQPTAPEVAAAVASVPGAAELQASVVKPEKNPHGGLLPMDVGKTGKVDYIRASGRNNVTVGNETRGPEWGEGRAREEFDRLREENARVPLGKRVEHELRNTIILRPDEPDELKPIG
jgi:hypothetical protein